MGFQRRTPVLEHFKDRLSYLIHTVISNIIYIKKVSIRYERASKFPINSES